MIQKSELILNNDGTIFHLHLKPENISDRIILVGDQARVDDISGFFDSVDFTSHNREFRTVTGQYNNQKLTVVSTGIGTDNIDIVLNELDALANIDFETREIKKEKKTLKFIRIGTSGSVQEDIPVNAFVVSKKSVGIDGMLSFYANREEFCDLLFEKAFKQYTNWSDTLPRPYVVDASQRMISEFDNPEFIKGITISAPGFYGPQGRVLRLQLAVPMLNRLIESFRFEEMKISNYEMESSAIYGLSKMLGHQALTVCLIIANRVTGKFNDNYRSEMKILIKKVLDILSMKK